MKELKIVSVADTPDDADTELRDRRDQVHADHREHVRAAVRRWMLYGIEIGERKLYLDDCPGLHAVDRIWVGDWLVEQGFTVKMARWFGRDVVLLEKQA